MAQMGSYCKAYPASAFRKYTKWSEKVSPLMVTESKSNGSGEEMNNGAARAMLEYFYLQENYTVTASVFLDENIAFDNVTPEWKSFCHDELNFSLPATANAAANGAPK